MIVVESTAMFVVPESAFTLVVVEVEAEDIVVGCENEPKDFHTKHKRRKFELY